MGNFLEGIEKVIVGLAIAIGVVGAAGGYAATKLFGNDDVIGVRITDEQQILLKNNALCEAHLTAAFGKALQESKTKGHIVDLKIPAGAAKDCPKP